MVFPTQIAEHTLATYDEQCRDIHQCLNRLVLQILVYVEDLGPSVF